jgi:hypothetical protein
LLSLHSPKLRAVELTTSDWREDLRALADGLPKKHANAFHEVSREKWLAAVADLDARIPSLSREEIEVGFMKLVALIGDGHTALSPFYRPEMGFHAVPLRFYLFSDGVFVLAADPAHADLVGAKLTRVGSLSVDEAFARVAETVSHDNEQGLKLVVPMYFGVSEILRGLGMIPPGRKVSYELEKEGRRFSVELDATIELGKMGHAGASAFAVPAGWVEARKDSRRLTPLWLKDPHDFYWREYLAESKTLYVQYNGVANKPGESIADFFEKTFEFAAAHPVEKFVIDLRLNSGGNNYLNRPVVRGLLRACLDDRGKLFVIIGRTTFSAAQNLVNDLSRYADPIFVGEPTGSRPNQFGDHEEVKLPRSALPVMASTLFWQDAGPMDHRPWTAPEIPAELSFAQFRDSVDPALQTILDYRSISRQLSPALSLGDPEGVRKAYEAFKADPTTVRIPTEREINTLGYRLLGDGKLDLAILVFQLNVESYPKSSNAYDSLGEACVAAKRFDRARESYQKVVELSPGNERAVRALKELENRARP